MSHLSGKDFDAMVGDLLIHFETVNATITDNTKEVQTDGIPDGYVTGDVSCSGEFEIDGKNFNLIIETAKANGSFRGLEPFDVICNAKSVESGQKFELFGCKFTISDLFSLDSKGGEKTKHKLPFKVTSPDFVRINGVPYLSEHDTRNL